MLAITCDDVADASGGILIDESPILAGSENGTPHKSNKEKRDATRK